MKKRAMTHDIASSKKLGGHVVEDKLAELINGVVVKSTGKTDIKTIDNKNLSSKRGFRAQIALYAENSQYLNNNLISSKKIKECLSVFPETYEEYEENKLKIKEKLTYKMIDLKNYLTENINHTEEYLNLLFLNNNEINFVSILDKDEITFHIFDATEFLKVLIDNTIIKNSESHKAGDISNLKVIFKIESGKSKSGKQKYRNIIENEIRTSTHYKRFLCVANTRVLLSLLKNKIPNTRLIYYNLVLYGDAISKFKY